MMIKISEEFSPVPTGRFERDGPYNGTAFREKFLVPAIKAGERVVIDIDGLFTYGHSFFDEALGGLTRSKSSKGEGLDECIVSSLVSLRATSAAATFFLPSLRKLLPSCETSLSA